MDADMRASTGAEGTSMTTTHCRTLVIALLFAAGNAVAGEVI
jgi:hypothetical protein